MAAKMQTNLRSSTASLFTYLRCPSSRFASPRLALASICLNLGQMLLRLFGLGSGLGGFLRLLGRLRRRIRPPERVLLLGVPGGVQRLQLLHLLRLLGGQVLRLADVGRQVEQLRGFSFVAGLPGSLPTTSFQSPLRIAHCSPNRQYSVSCGLRVRSRRSGTAAGRRRRASRPDRPCRRRRRSPSAGCRAG